MQWLVTPVPKWAALMLSDPDTRTALGVSGPPKRARSRSVVESPPWLAGAPSGEQRRCAGASNPARSPAERLAPANPRRPVDGSHRVGRPDADGAAGGRRRRGGGARPARAPALAGPSGGLLHIGLGAPQRSQLQGGHALRGRWRGVGSAGVAGRPRRRAGVAGPPGSARARPGRVRMGATAAACLRPGPPAAARSSPANHRAGPGRGPRRRVSGARSRALGGRADFLRMPDAPTGPLRAGTPSM